MARSKGWLIFFIIMGFFFLMTVLFVIGIRAAFDDKPIVRKNSVLKISLAGYITEQFPRDAFGREFEGANLQMNDIRKAIAMAKVDDRIRGIFLRISSLDIGWAKAQEIRKQLNDFKRSGKFVTAFMEMCDEKSYYTALAADEIFLQPQSFAVFNGFSAQTPFLKRMFTKLGIQAQVISIGKYKSAGDIYTRDSMRPANREATKALIEDVYEEFVGAVCDVRGLDRKNFESRLDRGIYQSEDAFDLKLVDGLKYETEVERHIKNRINDSGETATDGKRKGVVRIINASSYAKIAQKEVGLGKGEKIALVYAIGTIVPGASGFDPFMGRHMGSQSIIKHLNAAKKNSAIKAVVLRVDSPGGSGLASDAIWAAIERVREKKPVVISMSDVAASGGYWISMGCDAIVAQPLTITGSIGVVSSLFDLSGTYDKMGITWGTVKKGKTADMPTDKRPLTEKEWKIFKKMNLDFYQFFVQKVAEGRNKLWEEADAVGQGRVWTGVDALQHGLVDTLGGLETALTIAKEKAGIDVDAATQWVVYPQPKSFFESLVDRFNVRLAKHGLASKVEFAAFRNMPAEMKSLLSKMVIFGRIRKGEIMAIEPNVPDIR